MNDVQEWILFKMDYAYELFLYNYSKQTESKWFSQMFLKRACTFRLLKPRHCLEGSRWPATLFGMSFKMSARDLCLGILLSISVRHGKQKMTELK